MSIQYLSHTADIRMLISAKTLKDLFIEGVKGMNNILKESFCNPSNKIDVIETIHINASDYTTLLINFLSDVLSSSFIEKVVYCNIEIVEFKAYQMIVKLSGTRINNFDEEIKAVTYHEANVIQNKKGLWETCIIFDI